MKKLLNTRILLSGAMIILSAAVIVGAAFAFLSDTETSSGNTLEAGVLDLQIDNTSYYNGATSPNTTWGLNDPLGLFFDFRDLKPGDWGEDTISIHVNDNDAWGCFDTTLTSDDDNGTNEPELENDTPDDTGDDFDGELGGLLNFVFWVDDGDNVLEDNETDDIIEQGSANEVLDGLSVTLADSLSSLFVPDGDPLTGGATYFIAKAWCFGTLTLNPVAAGSGENPTVDGGITCDGTGLSNISQSDVLTADISFSVEQWRNNEDFFCDVTPTVTVTLTPTPTPIVACETPNNIFASSVVGNFQGLRKNGTAVLPDRSDPTDATGAPSDSPVVAGSFYSLGFPHANNSNTPGSITLDMGQAFYPNPSGSDLFVYEVTGGVYPDETVGVEARLSPSDPWTSLGTISRDGGVELGSLTSARYIRLTEASLITPFEATADGYDLDAVKAFCTEVTP